MNDYTISPIFPAAIQFNKLNRDFTKEELDCIINLPQKNNVLNTVSVDNYVLNNPKLLNLKNEVLKALQYYFHEILKANKDSEIYITQSWVNYTKEFESHHKHYHNNSFLSGVLYIDSNKELDKINFFKEKIMQLDIPATEWNLFNSPEWNFNVETLDLIIFPSYLTHAVETKKGDNTRISLAFNSFVKGKVGDNSSLTELILN